MNEQKHIARIVPEVEKDGSPCLTRGTRIMVGDVELNNVTRIELIACPNDVWRARIECFVIPPELTVDATVVDRKPVPFWRRALDWITGRDAIEVTNLESTSREYRMPRAWR